VLVVPAGRVVQVGLANQAVQVASVVSENPAGQGALGNRVAPVAPVALDQRDVRAAAQARGPQRDRAVVAPIRSVIVAYLQVQVHAAAASAVAAETLLAPAAAAAARA
jgi:hypothetical protein